ncbi:MAG: helix-turn-helix domain-containing protein [Deltaproteobacteria bacterium]|nr:helix-turn-helix domain-containing protein [Deltaproteobacteria bacterium]
MVNPKLRSSLWDSFRETVLNLGGDPQKILDKARLTSLEIEHPGLLMQSHSFERLLNVAAAETRSEYFSLYLSSRLDLSFMGTLGLLLQNADTVEAALKTLIRYQPVRIHWADPELKIEGETACLYTNNLHFSEQVKQYFYMSVGMGLTFLKIFLGENWKPDAVHLSDDLPEFAGQLNRLHGVPVLTARERNQIVFKASDLQQKISTFGQFGKYLQFQLDEMEQRFQADIASRSKYLIRTLLPEGACSIENVSSLLSLSKRTLRRRLQARGTTFTQLVEEVRQSITRQHIEQARLSFGQLSYLLGYSEPSAFSRAFKRWFGVAPSKWKNQ